MVERTFSFKTVDILCQPVIDIKLPSARWQLVLFGLQPGKSQIGLAELHLSSAINQIILKQIKIIDEKYLTFQKRMIRFKRNIERN